MNLKTSLQVSAVFPIALAILVSLSLILRSRQVGEAQRTFRSIENLTQAAAGLHMATYDCLLRRSQDAQEQWMVRQSTMSGALDAVVVDSTAVQIVLDRSRSELSRLKSTSADMAQASAGMARVDSGAGGQLLTDSESLLQNAFDLARMADQNTEESQGNADMIFAVFIGIMGLLMAAATLSVSRDVVHRLGRLNQWAQAVSGGHFDATLDVAGNNDELGQVTRVFSQMTQRLGTAHGAMEKEISEHRRVADALRQSNILLSNALENLKRAQYQIVQQERLHVLEQIVRGVAHDFNNTLTPILGMSDFMIGYPQSLTQPEQVLSNLKDINEAARRAKNDVRKLSEFFRPTKGSGFQAVDMNGLITDVIQLTEPRWKGRGRTGRGPITVSSDPGQVPPVAGDHAELREVLTNLILNAVEALPKGGQITLSTRRADAMVLVEVKDNGDGMAPEVLDRCWEPFFSTKGVEGTGMGLTVVNNAVRRHGGTREIQSQKGKGTTVSIKLPVWKESEAAARENVALPTVTRELRVLVIDDESWSRDIVSKMLVSEKHRVDIATNGREGLDMVKSGSYDLVITDRAMPDMSGDEVALAIRKSWPQLRVILLTGFGDIMKEEGDNPEGVDIILSKPITLSDLSTAISRATSTSSE